MREKTHLSTRMAGKYSLKHWRIAVPILYGWDIEAENYHTGNYTITHNYTGA